MRIEDSVMYDMATWSGPIAYNLQAYSTAGSFSVSKTEVTEPMLPEGKVLNQGAQYAYVIEWKQKDAPKALAYLWKRGYRVRAANEPFSDGKYSFGSGSLIILKGRNRNKSATIDDEMLEIAQATGVTIVGFETGRMLTGMDLANTSNRPVKQPKVALLVEEPFSSYTAGQIYFLFDQATELPIERVRLSTLKQTALPKYGYRFGGVDLMDYDVLILPGGGSNLKDIFQEEQLEEIKEWVQSGGVLIATESAAGFFTKDQSKFAGIEMKKAKKDSSEAMIYLPYAEREEYFGKKRIPGSALNATIDNTHPLAFGMPADLYSLTFGNDALKPSPGMQTVGYYEKDPGRLLVAGYASPENLDHLAGQTFAGVVEMGR
jgi:putative intracellular protease/amidase